MADLIHKKLNPNFYLILQEQGSPFTLIVTAGIANVVRSIEV
jgi:hypothetical protein